jgi:hypothetical protein
VLNYVIDREGDERCWGLDRLNASAHLLAIWLMAKAPTSAHVISILSRLK